MLLEKDGIWSQNQAITGAASFVSTNDMDLKSSPFRDIAIGIKQIYVVSQITTALSAAGITVTVNLQQSPNPAAGPYTVIEQLGTFQSASIVGTKIFNQIAPGNITQEYLSIGYVITGGNLTTGAVTTFATPDIQEWFPYQKNYTISTS